VGDLHTTISSGSLGFSSVGILDNSVEPLPKGLSLWVRRHGGEEAAVPIRGWGGKGLGATTSSSNQEERVGVKW
jgi:hypothetical protein